MRIATAAILVGALSPAMPGPESGLGPGDGLSPPATREPTGSVVLNWMESDLEALARFRPGYSFWAHVFSTPDGSVVFGSAADGRLLATFPARGDWQSEGRWLESSMQNALAGLNLPRRLEDRRDEVAKLLDTSVGPVVHNPTRGDFVAPNARRFGSFLDEWGRIYERFGVPSELGLAQAMVESGFSGTIKSEARAIGFCQWLPRNWARMQKLSPHVIEVQNQTTQASYCAAYLTVLAAKYGSFIPALSEHHAGGVNVGLAVINGGRLGAEDMRERYFVGAQFARDLRALSPRTFQDLVGTYGPRSFLYTEMVFGSMSLVSELRSRSESQKIFAMRVDRAIPIAEVARVSGLSIDEVKRFNPALVKQVPRGATVYLPAYFAELGVDISFWHRTAPASFTAVMDEFLALSFTPSQWERTEFEPRLREFRTRFSATGTEEGAIMAAAIGYSIEEIPAARRILDEFRTNSRIERLFEEGVQLRLTSTASAVGVPWP